MKEDNLSEMIIEPNILLTIYVKEFIKKVIEVAQSDWTKEERVEWIKKLAGDALI